MALKIINPANKTARGTQNCTSRNMATHHFALLPFSVLFSLIMSYGPRGADYHNHSRPLRKRNSAEFSIPSSGADVLSAKRSERNFEKSHFRSAALAACTTSRATPTSNAVNASKNPALAA
jgi:hypothetical protein